MLSEQRSLLLFQQAIKSEATKKAYLYQLEKFRKWTKIKNYNGLLEAPPKQIQELIEDYMMFLKKSVSPNSIPIYFAPIELFFVMNDINLNFKKIRKLFPDKVKKGNERAYTRNEIQKILQTAKSHRNKALVLIQALSGCRVGAISGIKLRHLSRIEDCYSIVIYEGDKEEDMIFVAPEGVNEIDAYLDERQKDGEKLTKESPLIRTEYKLGIEKVKETNVENITKIMARLVSVIERKKIGKTNRFDVAKNHGLRKYFATAIKQTEGISVTMSEKLINHKGVAKLDGSYFRPSTEEMFTAYKKAIPKITIDDSLRQQNKLDKTIKEKSELEKVNTILQQTIKEKDEMAQKSNDTLLSSSVEKLVSQKVKEILEKQNLH